MSLMSVARTLAHLSPRAKVWVMICGDALFLPLCMFAAMSFRLGSLDGALASAPGVQITLALLTLPVLGAKVTCKTGADSRAPATEPIRKAMAANMHSGRNSASPQIITHTLTRGDRWASDRATDIKGIGSIFSGGARGKTWRSAIVQVSVRLATRVTRKTWDALQSCHAC